MNSYILEIKEFESCSLIQHYYIVSTDFENGFDRVEKLDCFVNGFTYEKAKELKGIWDDLNSKSEYSRIYTEIIEL